MPAKLKTALQVLLTISLVPALLLAWQRARYEEGQRTLAVAMDYTDVVAQARRLGIDDPLELLSRYRRLGVNTVAVYEDSLRRLVQADKVVYREGSSWRNDRLSLGRSVQGIRSDHYYLRSLVPGTAERFAARYLYPRERVSIDGQAWLAFSVDLRNEAAGPDLGLIRRLESSGFQVAYRPFNSPAATSPGADFPKVPYLIHAGDEVVGYPDERSLESVRRRSLGSLTGLIEASDQAGMDSIARDAPVVRVFAIRPEWQARLAPQEVASKFVLAARERNHRLLYLRPYRRVDDTETMLRSIQDGLARARLQLGTPVAVDYRPDETLRSLSALGPLLALGLLALCYPWVRLGALVAAGTLGLAVVAAGPGYDGLALLAAIVFPALGFALHRRSPWDWLRATLVTIMGGLFLVALGSDRATMLALDPFRGVALTLVLPPLLVAGTLVPRQDPRRTLRDLWNAPVNLGTLALAGVAVAAVALIVMRRGNTPAVGVGDAEARIRAQLQDSLIRPRTKEVLMHPVALLALGAPSAWPAWFANLLLVAGVIGQGSIVDTFAHYHTPLVINLLRTLNGVAFGLAIGVVLLPVAWLATRLFAGGPAGRRGARARGARAPPAGPHGAAGARAQAAQPLGGPALVRRGRRARGARCRARGASADLQRDERERRQVGAAARAPHDRRGARAAARARLPGGRDAPVGDGRGLPRGGLHPADLRSARRRALGRERRGRRGGRPQRGSTDARHGPEP